MANKSQVIKVQPMNEKDSCALRDKDSCADPDGHKQRMLMADQILALRKMSPPSVRRANTELVNRKRHKGIVNQGHAGDLDDKQDTINRSASEKRQHGAASVRSKETIKTRNKSVTENERRFRANDPEYNASFKYANNYIKTSKYNVFTFLPKNAFEQFQRLANTYFLFLLILQLVPQISSLTPLTTVIPLLAVLAISAIKDAVDDIQRHKSDNQVNNRKSWVLRHGQLVEERWHKVVVGDIIKMEDNQFVAADILLLSTSEPNSLCYIETAELDGETNLKVKQALPDTARLGDDIEKYKMFDAEIVCEPPNNHLNKFEGVMMWNGKTYSLDNDKVLLRGCVLRNTQWCFGIVIFAGQDTKLMMNSGKTKFKRTNIDRLMNLLIIGIFIFLISVCLICTVCCGVWEFLVGNKFQVYLPWQSFVPGSPDKPDGTIGAGSTVIALMVFFSYIIILNTVVPISLYVSVEIIRLFHSWWINWDIKMYYELTDTPAKSRTTTLNEELGQIEYIFSDKTGTLTQNIMTFNKCSIKGKAYGDPVDEYGNAVDITERTPKVPMPHNRECDPKFCWFDRRLIEKIESCDPDVEEFFRLLALCHTVMVEENNGQLEYQAQSPDENALVSAAQYFGFVFKSRTPETITIEVNGKTEEYELLCILDFNNVRKKNVFRRNGIITLYCKGADSTIYERLHPSTADMQEYTTSHLNDFAQFGLRTLCLAKKEIEPEYWEEWKIRYHTASTSLENRDDKVSALYEEIEKDMILLGATAIEDKLQDGVPDCIANLALANIKIWVLTGDKQETAINIGYSCKLLTDEMQEIYVVDGETFEEVEKQLRDAKNEMLAVTKGGVQDPVLDMVSVSNGRTPTPGFQGMNGNPGNEAQENQEFGGFALVINGHSLVHALNEKLELLLFETGTMCKAVICCRVTPLQKALVVDMVKKRKKAITLAIGDGANDVSMIKTAHIGVGISGQEGMQAVLASDFALAQFRYLEQLLLVHGRWSYLRMCKFLRYFFYKNFAFTLCHFWFAFFCGFSAQTVFDPGFITLYNVIYTSLPVMAMGVFDQTLYDEAFISLYNVCYTSLPILAMGIFEQDVNEYYSLRYPKLYAPGHLNLLFNKKVFAQSVAEGIISSLVLFFIPYCAFHDAIRPDGTDLANHKAFGVMVAATLIVTVTLRCALDTSYWTGFNHFVIWASILFFFCFTFIFYIDFFGYSYVGTARMLMSTANFWFTLVLTVTVLLLPIVAERFYYIDTRPTLTDKVRLKQKISKSKSKSSELILRRASTFRRSQRSLQRSGYAFAHQEGFGELITKGTNMRASMSGQQLQQHRRTPAASSDGKANRIRQSASKSALNSANGDTPRDKDKP